MGTGVRVAPTWRQGCVDVGATDGQDSAPPLQDLCSGLGVFKHECAEESRGILFKTSGSWDPPVPVLI